MYYAIEKLKTSMLNSTHQLQKLLHLSVVIEASIIGITMTVPLSFVGIMIIFPIPYGSYIVYIAFILMSFQTSLSALAQFYFIKPFKKCAMDVVQRVLKIFFCKKLNNSNVWVVKFSVHANQI